MTKNITEYKLHVDVHCYFAQNDLPMSYKLGYIF